MAALSRSRGLRGPDGLPDPRATPEGVSPSLPGRALAATDADGQPVDPRAVRVSLAPASAGAGLEPITVSPGEAGGAALEELDAERAILAVRTEPGVRVLLLPAAAAPGLRGVSRREVIVDGWRLEVDVEPASRAALRARAQRGREERGHSGPSEVRAIIPGVVVSVSVAPGDEVVAGQQLLAVEAMKMQNELRAPRDGVIERVAIAVGQTIEVGDLLLVIA